MSLYPYEKMLERQDLLERLDIAMVWGHYEIRVMRFHLTSFPAGRVVDFHNHAEFEFHFIPRGKGKVILDDQTHALSEGMLYLTVRVSFIIRRRMPKRIWMNSVFMWISFTSQESMSILGKPLNLRRRLKS